jgi:hypothetical protein
VLSQLFNSLHSDQAMQSHTLQSKSGGHETERETSTHPGSAGGREGSGRCR